MIPDVQTLSVLIPKRYLLDLFGWFLKLMGLGLSVHLEMMGLGLSVYVMVCLYLHRRLASSYLRLINLKQGIFILAGTFYGHKMGSFLFEVNF